MKKLYLILIIALVTGLGASLYATNGSRYFDGANDDYTVTIGDMTNHIQHTFTFEVWFKTATLSLDNSEGGHGQIGSPTYRGRTIFASSNELNNWAAWLSLYGNTLKFYAFMNLNNYNNQYFEYTIPTLTPETMDTWYHVAVSATRAGNGREGVMRMYVNGDPVPNQNPNGGTIGSYTKPAGNVTNWLTVMYLGDLRKDRYYHFKGWLDDARIWNVIRTDDEIKDNYRFPISHPTGEDDLIGYWKFDEEEGGDVTNSSGKTGVGGASLSGEAEAGWSSDGNPTLPVVLSNFMATVTSQNFVSLNWITQSETGALGYLVYRSNQDLLWEAELISPLIPATNTSSQQIYLFNDKDVTEGTWYYWLESLDVDGSFEYHGPIHATVIDHATEYVPQIPAQNRISRIYPNPFNPHSTIGFELVNKSDVAIKIYNTRGQLVQTFELGSKDAGNHEIVWDASQLSSGVYIIKMQANGQVYQSKAILSK